MALVLIKKSLNIDLLKTFIANHCPQDQNDDDEGIGDSFGFIIDKHCANRQRPPKIDLHAKCQSNTGGALPELEVTLNQKKQQVSISCSNCDIDVCPHGIGFVKWLIKSTSVKSPGAKSPPTTTAKRGRESTIATPTNPEKVFKETTNQVPKVLQPVVIELSDEDEEQSNVKTIPKPLNTIALDSQSSAVLTMAQLMRTFMGSTDTEVEFVEHCRTKMAMERCDEAQLLTVEQAETELWHQLRIGRITASRMHQASRCKMSRGSLFDSIMGRSRGGFSFAMDRGTNLEDDVFNVVRKEYPDLQKSGLLLNSQYPYFGASPDGVHEDFVLEIKCPLNWRTHSDYVTPGKLKKQYAAQIQVQMKMAKKCKALLAVADPGFERNKKITKMWIDYDEEYTKTLMEDAYEFWVGSIFTALKRQQSK